MYSNKILKLLFILFACSPYLTETYATVRQQQVLKDNWFIKQLDDESHDISALTQAVLEPDTSWMQATMPKQVAEVLLENGKIDDPHIGKNAVECAWIWEKDWAYGTTFPTPKGTGAVLLRLKGVDTIQDYSASE